MTPIFACYALMIDNDHEASLELFPTEAERDAFMWTYAFDNSDTDAATLDAFKEECDNDLSDAMERTNDGWKTEDMVPELPDNRRDDANDTVDAMVRAESFISGFEDDETQEGVADILLGLRTAIAVEQAAPDMLAALKATPEECGEAVNVLHNLLHHLPEDKQVMARAACDRAMAHGAVIRAAIAKAETIRA